MIVGCDDVKMLDSALLEFGDEGSEVGYGVNGAIVEVKAIAGNFCFLKDGANYIGRSPGGNPNI